MTAYTITLTQEQLWDTLGALQEASDRAAAVAERLESRGQESATIRDAQRALLATRRAVAAQAERTA